MNEWTWTVGKGEFIGQISLLDAPVDVARRLRRPLHQVPLGFVSDLEVHPARRNQGWANTLMSSITRHADRELIDLWTYVEPFGPATGRMTRGGLLTYYMRWGFQLVENPEYEYEMVRRCRR